MSYQVLARKYRPSNFATLRGHEILTTVFKNAVKHNKISHAYLLTGIRGVGKTTAARIIAKTVNCLNLLEDGSPCEKCRNCISSKENSNVDTIELDAASKTGVDDVRKIIESSKFQPLNSKYKVYIIDEVHMLSISAFNALLKTLEEPPEHLIFIFATTEFRKIPTTIVSRCQTFKLGRLTNQNVIDCLKDVCTAEKIKVEEDALQMIAEFSEGSVRDALSVLETARFYQQNIKKAITAACVSQVIGVPDFKSIYTMLEAIFKNDVKDAVHIAQDLYNSGNEVEIVIEELLKATTKLVQFMSLSESEQSILKSLKQVDITVVMNLWKMLVSSLEELKYAPSTIGTLEVFIIRLCYFTKKPANVQPSIDVSKEKKDAVSSQPSTVSNKSVMMSDVASSPMIQEVLKEFPGSRVASVFETRSKKILDVS